MKMRIVLLLMLGISFPAIAQRDNTFYVRQFENRDTRTVGAMTTKAQAACTPGIPCVIVFDPSLAAYGVGTMPAQCPNCVWVDWRNSSGPQPASDVPSLRTSATCDGTVDDTANIQATINAAGASRIPLVVINRGKPQGGGEYASCRISQISLPQRIGLTCEQMDTAASTNACLRQLPNQNKSMIIFQGDVTATDHLARLFNMTISGDPLNTVGCGFDLSAAQSGEAMKFERIFASNFAESGLCVRRGTVPLYVEDFHAFRNGVAGIDINHPFATYGNQGVTLVQISGDDNGVALIRIKNSCLTCTEAFGIFGVKSEKHTAGRQNNQIVLDHMGSAPVAVFDVASLNTSGEVANSVVQTIGEAASLMWGGISAGAGVVPGATWNSIVDDTQGMTGRIYDQVQGTAGMINGAINATYLASINQGWGIRWTATGTGLKSWKCTQQSTGALRCSNLTDGKDAFEMGQNGSSQTFGTLRQLGDATQNQVIDRFNSSVKSWDLQTTSDGGFQAVTSDATKVGIKFDINGVPRFPQVKSTSGTRFMCVDSTGVVTASATACSGT